MSIVLIIENELEKDKAKQGIQRKQKFDQKNKSEQNLYNLRRQFNLGNIEEGLEKELFEILNEEQTSEQENLVSQGDDPNNLVNPVIQEENANNYYQGDLNNVLGEDEHGYQDIFD